MGYIYVGTGILYGVGRKINRSYMIYHQQQLSQFPKFVDAVSLHCSAATRVGYVDDNDTLHSWSLQRYTAHLHNI